MVGLPGAICSAYNRFPVSLICRPSETLQNWSKVTTKLTQLKRTYGNRISFILFLCGYFDAGYLGYEASEGIDWIWEHRIEDFVEFGV